MVVEMVREELVLISFFLSFHLYCKRIFYPNKCAAVLSKHISAKRE